MMSTRRGAFSVTDVSRNLHCQGRQIDLCHPERLRVTTCWTCASCAAVALLVQIAMEVADALAVLAVARSWLHLRLV